MTSYIFQAVKEKTNIRGFWRNEAGKLYIDNLLVLKYSHEIKQESFNSGELAVFYVNSDGHAIIEDKKGNITVLKTKECITVKRLKGRLVKDFVNAYGGVTIHKIDSSYILTAWH
jgi:hypothetical protein